MNSKKLNKIYLKIDLIAKKGDLGKLEYYQFIDELIDKGEFYLFQDVMIKKYGIDTSYIETYNVKKKTFDQIRFQTNSKFQEDLKKFCDSVNVSFKGCIKINGEIVHTCESVIKELFNRGVLEEIKKSQSI